ERSSLIEYALRSSDPKTEAGKRRSRRNAIGTEDRRNSRCRSGRHIGDHPSIRSGYLRGLRRLKQRDKRHCELVVRHSLASYAVENHRTPLTAVTSGGDFMVRIGRPKNIFRGDPCPGCGSTPPVALLEAGIGCTSWRPAG